MLYVIRDAAGRLKIGFASDPKRRLRELQIGASDALDLLLQLETLNDSASEYWIHQRLLKFHKRGEWFEVPLQKVLNLLPELPYLPETQPSLELTFPLPPIPELFDVWARAVLVTHRGEADPLDPDIIREFWNSDFYQRVFKNSSISSWDDVPSAVDRFEQVCADVREMESKEIEVMFEELRKSLDLI